VFLHIEFPSTDKYMRALIFTLVVFMFAVPSFARNAISCAPEEMSEALLGACLTRELKEEETVLALKLNALRQGIKRQDFSSNPDIDREAKRDFLRAFDEADRFWRALVKSECLVLLAGDTYGGNGAVNAGLQCQLDRTTSRVVEIEKSEPYKWIAR